MASELTYEMPAVGFTDNVYAKAEQKTARKKFTCLRITSAIVFMIFLAISVTALTISLLLLKRMQMSTEASSSKVTKSDANIVEDWNTTQATSTSVSKFCKNGDIHNPFSNTCLTLSSISLSWQEAKNYCERGGENLATFESFESSLWFINSRKTIADWKNEESVWVGGKKDIDGVWRWHGKSIQPIYLVLWGPGEPSGNGNCVKSWSDADYKLDDTGCSVSHRFSCEY